MDKSYRLKLFGKIRTALVFSVLSTIMQTLNAIFMPADIIMVALTSNFVCAVLHNVVLGDIHMRRRFHCGYILRSISRQSVLVISSAIANNIHMRDIGTQHENTIMLIISTTAFIGVMICVPEWFLQDAQQGSLKNMLIYNFTARYNQLHLPGLGGNTGIGTILYGLLFIVTTLVNNTEDASNDVSAFMKTLQQTASMIFSNIFLRMIAPESTRQVLPVALLIAMYIASDCIKMSKSVSVFVLWRTAAEVSSWTTRVFPGGFTDQFLLYTLLLCIVPVINEATASVLAVAAIQTLVQSVMISMVYLGPVGTVVSSVCVLLVTDIVLDAP
jgi:hypothetical protein